MYRWRLALPAILLAVGLLGCGPGGDSDADPGDGAGREIPGRFGDEEDGEDSGGRGWFGEEDGGEDD